MKFSVWGDKAYSYFCNCFEEKIMGKFPLDLV